MKNKKWTWLAVAMLAALAPAVAFAGYKQSVAVTCDDRVSSCWGMLLSTQNSTDNVQEIYCSTNGRKVAGVFTREASCFAKTVGGTQRSCTSTAPAMADAAAAVSFESHVSFSWSNGECTNITVRNTSAASP
jgi:hypothetical protein